MARTQYRRQKQLSDINITNLVDVTLVLLVIFIIVAPFLEQGLDIQLPEAKGENVIRNAIVVEMASNGDMVVDREPVSFETLQPKLQALAGGPESATRPVHIRGDRDVRYGDLARVLSLIKDAGYQNVNFVTEPLEQ